MEYASPIRRMFANILRAYPNNWQKRACPLGDASQGCG